MKGLHESNLQIMAKPGKTDSLTKSVADLKESRALVRPRMDQSTCCTSQYHTTHRDPRNPGPCQAVTARPPPPPQPTPLPTPTRTENKKKQNGRMLPTALRSRASRPATSAATPAVWRLVSKFLKASGPWPGIGTGISGTSQCSFSM